MSKSILQELTETQRPDNFDEDQMGVLAETVNRLIVKQQQIIDAEESLKLLKVEERGINQGEIPLLMENLGFDKITLKDGRVLSVKDSVQISIPAPQRIDAYQWMDKHGHGDLIKLIITAKFQRGERDVADETMDAMIDAGASPVLAESVHSGTLKAWARIELEQGHSLPVKFFKVHVVKITTVK